LEVEFRRYIVRIHNPDITSESNGLGFKNVYKSMDKLRYFPVRVHVGTLPVSLGYAEETWTLILWYPIVIHYAAAFSSPPPYLLSFSSFFTKLCGNFRCVHYIKNSNQRYISETCP
jgi:hypothetical protein